MFRYQPLTTTVMVVIWTLVSVPLALSVAFAGGLSFVSSAVAVLAAIDVLLAAYAVPALIGGKM